MDEHKSIRPDVEAYQGIRIAAGEGPTFGGFARLLTAYRGAELLGVAGVIGLYYTVIAPVSHTTVHLAGIVAMGAVVVIGMLVTGRRHAPTEAGTGETKADP